MIPLLLAGPAALGLALAASPTPKDEVERLMAEGMPFAEKMLAEHGEFVPYANALGSDGTVVAVAVKLKDEHPDSQRVIEELESALRSGIAKGQYRAGAIFVDVRAQPPGAHEMVDAVRVGLEHVDGFCADIYVPYTRSASGDVTAGTAFASKRKGRFTKACT